MKVLGKFQLISETKIKSVSLSSLNEGINILDNHIINYLDGEVKYLIDKKCDHAGGKLIVKNNYAVCPMHNWKLNLVDLSYNSSHLKKTILEFKREDDSIFFQENISTLLNPFKGSKRNFQFRWLNHSTIYFELDGKSIMTDPWLIGSAFLNGWWLKDPSPSDSLELLKNVDYVFISHNHPDHLNPETLNYLPKDTEIIVPNFVSHSTSKYLHSLGFTNVIEVDFSMIYQISENIQFSIFKSGDFRDDSGFYFCVNGVEVLLTVDANFLNSHILPQNIDLLMTSFASGASGFPLCYENYSEEEKIKIVERNKKSTKFSVSQYLKATTPKYYIPYAGMFKEYAIRDKYISDNNKKNSVEDYVQICSNTGTILIEPLSNVIYKFQNGALLAERFNVQYLQKDNIESIINNTKNRYSFDFNAIQNYFLKSNYKEKQILYILPTDDDFKKIIHPIIYVDFYTSKVVEVKESEIIEEVNGFKVMKIKIRSEILMNLILNMLPWEDFSIGFQMRVKRSPNEYESDFWYYFTNEYIKDENFRYSKNCGSCEIANQNKLWI
jgi:CMP-N-acetylneuraminate monooxygenase